MADCCIIIITIIIVITITRNVIVFIFNRKELFARSNSIDVNRFANRSICISLMRCACCSVFVVKFWGVQVPKRCKNSSWLERRPIEPSDQRSALKKAVATRDIAGQGVDWVAATGATQPKHIRIISPTCVATTTTNVTNAGIAVDCVAFEYHFLHQFVIFE